MVAPYLFLTALSALAWGDRIQPDLTSALPDPVVINQPSVVLITVDALRADRLGAYGYARQTSPHLDAMAWDGVVFERAYASTPSTSFSIASLLIGRHAYAVTRESNLDGFETLADWLGAAGYQTAALYPPAVYFSATNAFDGVRERHLGFRQIVHDALPEDRDAVERTDSAIRILREHRDNPVFLWAHYFAPHEPYTSHPEIFIPGDRLLSDSELYDEEVRWVDREIGRLLDYLQAERPNCIVVVTADHGEEFGEHGGAYHGTTLFDEQLRVPLLIRAPGLLPRREEEPVSTVEVRRILEQLLSQVAHPISLVPESSPVFAELGALKSVIVGRHKEICDLWNSRCQLFNLANDPGEQHDLATKQPRRLRVLRKLIDSWVAANPSGGALSAGPKSVQDLLRPARRKDRSSARVLQSLLQMPSTGEKEKAEAARLLATAAFPHQKARLRKLWRAEDSALNRWLAVALARLGDLPAKRWLGTFDTDRQSADAEFLAHRAIVLAHSPEPHAIARVSDALSQIEDDHLRCRLFAALGKLGGRAARDILMSSYGEVRTRHCVAVALAQLRDPATAEFLSGRIATEPYANVRAVLVRALGMAGGASYRSHLQEIRAGDREPIVSSAADAALTALSKSRSAAPQKYSRLRKSEALNL